MVLATIKQEIVSLCILEVEAGSNCPQGGDSGHGGRTYLRLSDQASTDMRLRFTPNDGSQISQTGWMPVREVELMFGGDAERECLVHALRRVLEALRADDVEEENEGLQTLENSHRLLP